MSPASPAFAVALLLALALQPPRVLAADHAASSVAAGTLYARLGGETGVAAIAADVIDRAATDARTRLSCEGVTRSRVKQHLATQLCELSDGGCHREGNDMRTVHAGLDISEAEFHGLVEILRDVLLARGAAIRPRNELVALLAPMKREVVAR